MKVCCFQNSLENLQSPGGYVQMHVIPILQLEAGAWSSQGLPTPPPASAASSRREGSPGGPSNATPPPFFFLPLAAFPSLSPVSPAGARAQAVAAAAARRLPPALRLAVDLRLAALFLPTRGIDRPRPETPPTPPFLLQVPTAAPPKSVTAGLSPTKPTSPSSSW
jgi:hypothetical protein